MSNCISVSQKVELLKPGLRGCWVLVPSVLGHLWGKVHLLEGQVLELDVLQARWTSVDLGPGFWLGLCKKKRTNFKLIQKIEWVLKCLLISYELLRIFKVLEFFNKEWEEWLSAAGCLVKVLTIAVAYAPNSGSDSSAFLKCLGVVITYGDYNICNDNDKVKGEKRDWAAVPT